MSISYNIACCLHIVKQDLHNTLYIYTYVCIYLCMSLGNTSDVSHINMYKVYLNIITISASNYSYMYVYIYIYVPGNSV